MESWFVWKNKKWFKIFAVIGLIAGLAVGCSKKSSGVGSAPPIDPDIIGSSCLDNTCVELDPKGTFASATGKLAAGWTDFGVLSVDIRVQNSQVDFLSLTSYQIADYYIMQNLGAFGVKGVLSIEQVMPDTCNLPVDFYSVQTVQLGNWSGKHGNNTVEMEVNGRSNNTVARIRMSFNILSGPGNYTGIGPDGNIMGGYEYIINSAPFHVLTVNGQNCNRGTAIVTN